MRHGWVFLGELCLFLLTGHPVVFGAHPPPFIILQVPETEGFSTSGGCLKECIYNCILYLGGHLVFMPPIVVY